MKSNILFFVCALSAFTLSSYVYSQESKVCANPLKTICTDTKDQRDQRSLYIKNLKTEISTEAQQNAVPRIAEMKKKFPGISHSKLKSKSTVIRNQEIMKSAKSRISGIETVVTNSKNISLLKKYMKQAIDESKLNSMYNEYFKDSIDSIMIGNFSDFIERTGIEDDILGQLGTPCGLDGMTANAFAAYIHEERYVLICPGFLITLSQTANKQERLDSILQAVSHEMGHHIDLTQVGAEVYMPYLSCLSQNYVGQFKKTKYDIDYCKKAAKNKEDCNLQVTFSHAGELIADQWAIKVLAIHAKAKGYSAGQADSLLTNSFANLCDSKDEGVHPSGDFRIGSLLRINPEISDYLSCNNSSVKRPACTFDGEIKL